MIMTFRGCFGKTTKMFGKLIKFTASTALAGSGTAVFGGWLRLRGL